jgi:hypothetical protein
MSSVCFHTPSDDVRLSGAERGLFRNLCTNMFLGYIVPQMCEWHTSSKDKLARFSDSINESHWIKGRIHNYLVGDQDSRHIEKDLELFFSVENTILTFPEAEFELFSLSLNTALLLGSDPIKLAARIHGQCELHCWIAAQNKEWIAGIIERSLSIGLYRQGMGWDDVLALLRKNADEPVVLSFSGCNSFPNSDVADFPLPEDEYGDPDPSLWEALDNETQWELAFAGLQKKEGGLELSPDGWDDFYFTDKKCNAIELDRLLSF